jgi:hypothetical protein
MSKTSQSPYTNGRKDFIETDARVGKISLLIADTDCMPIGAVHEKDLNLARWDPEFVEPPRPPRSIVLQIHHQGR